MSVWSLFIVLVLWGVLVDCFDGFYCWLFCFVGLYCGFGGFVLGGWVC